MPDQVCINDVDIVFGLAEPDVPSTLYLSKLYPSKIKLAVEVGRSLKHNTPVDIHNAQPQTMPMSAYVPV